jgi:hypothetical protein
MSKKKKIEVTVSRHMWLDCSVSWFVNINGVKSGGEIYSEKEAIKTAKSLAESLGGKYTGMNNTNEMF